MLRRLALPPSSLVLSPPLVPTGRPLLLASPLPKPVAGMARLTSGPTLLGPLPLVNGVLPTLRTASGRSLLL